MSPVGDAARLKRVLGGVAIGPTGNVTRVNVSVPSARHHSSIAGVVPGRNTAAHSRAGWPPTAGVHRTSVQVSCLLPDAVGTPVGVSHSVWGAAPAARVSRPFEVAAAMAPPAGWRARRKMLSPMRLVASAVNTGSVSGLVEGAVARRMPTPGRRSPGMPSTRGDASPVPTHTSSFVGSSLPPVTPHSTHRQPVASGLAATLVAVGSAGRQPPIARQVFAPSSVYQTPPLAAAAYGAQPLLRLDPDVAHPSGDAASR